MLKHLIILTGLIFASLFGYIRYYINPLPAAIYEPAFIGEFVVIQNWHTDTAISAVDISNRRDPELVYDYVSGELLEKDAVTRFC